MVTRELPHRRARAHGDALWRLYVTLPQNFETHEYQVDQPGDRAHGPWLAHRVKIINVRLHVMSATLEPSWHRGEGNRLSIFTVV
jgi:hypothetical protein